MRTVRRLISLLLLLAVAAALVSVYVAPQQWLVPQLEAFLRLQDRRAAASASTESLPAYTRKVAARPWFQRYFTRLAFSEGDGPDSYPGQVTKWTKRRVRIDVVNNGGPGMEAYVRRIVSRLNRMQSATRFAVVDGPAEVTIEYLSHEAYTLTVGSNSVGNCETRFYTGAPGLVSAAIKINAGILKSPAQRQPVVIHELTHALGFKGHFTQPEDRTRSVLYYAASINSWSRDDGAAIRIMYSSKIRNGMNVSAVRKALRKIGASSAME